FHRKDAVDAQFGGLFHHPFEAVELDQAGAEGDGDRGQDGGEGFEDLEHYTFAACLGDFSQVSLLVIGDLKTLSGFDAQDAGEVARLVATQLGGAAANRVHKESTPCQTTWWHKLLGYRWDRPSPFAVCRP